MDRNSPREKRAALDVIAAEAPHLTPAQVLRFYRSTITIARRLHGLYEGVCSVDLGEHGNAVRQHRIEHTEAALKAMFLTAGLGLYLNADPRGNPVGILTPKTGRYNTWGGAEAGWRL